MPAFFFFLRVTAGAIGWYSSVYIYSILYQWNKQEKLPTGLVLLCAAIGLLVSSWWWLSVHLHELYMWMYACLLVSRWTLLMVLFLLLNLKLFLAFPYMPQSGENPSITASSLEQDSGRRDNRSCKPFASIGRRSVLRAVRSSVHHLLLGGLLPPPTPRTGRTGHRSRRRGAAGQICQGIGEPGYLRRIEDGVGEERSGWIHRGEEGEEHLRTPDLWSIGESALRSHARVGQALAYLDPIFDPAFLNPTPFPLNNAET